jgi:hypothetical protein
MASLARSVVALSLLLAPLGGAWGDAPRPPCETSPLPAYPDPGNAPAVRVWTGEELGAGWIPPTCTGWGSFPIRMLVATAGRLPYAGDADSLLARFGAVSSLSTVKYWSTSDQRWEGLITHAAALDGPDTHHPRPDFRIAEMVGGADLFFAQDDNRSTGDVVYRLRVREIKPDRLVVEAENTSPVRYLMFPLAGPGDLRSLYFLERWSTTEWGYYSLTGVGAGASALAVGHQASYVNRAIALFRHLAGLPTDQEPPAAP